MCGPCHRRGVGKCWLITGAAMLAAASGLSQPADPAFEDAQNITAVDVLVDVRARRADVPALPTYLVPDDFEVLYDGEPKSVVGVSAFGPAQHAPDGEPWTLVIYFDRRLTGPAEAGWAAGELLEAVDRLTDLGRVEVVVADPDPRLLVEPTRDRERLGSALAEIALFPEGDDHELLKLRDELLAELNNERSEIDPAELVPFALAEEKRIVRNQLDALVTYLADSGAGARRALFLVNTGFDLLPEDFYGPHLGRSATISPQASGDLAVDLEAAGRALAAYGWITVPLVPPPDRPAAGLRLGKWRLGKPGGGASETPLDPLNPHDTVGPVLFEFLKLTREGNRDAEKAADYLELGETLARQDDLAEAEQALRMALHHFGDAPAAAEDRASTLVRLGGVLERQGRRREARGVFEKARELDPNAVAPAMAPFSELSDPSAPVERLAEWTTGTPARGQETLFRVLAELPYRVRLTYQVPGNPDGTLHPLEIRCRRRGCRLEAPGWARSGTPDEVAAARLRRWLEDDQIEGSLRVKARLVPGISSLDVEVEIPAAAAPGAPRRGPALRVTLGYGDPESISATRHGRAAPGVLEDGGRWGFRIRYSPALLPATPGSGVALLVEHLETGEWGATVVELPAS